MRRLWLHAIKQPSSAGCLSYCLGVVACCRKDKEAKKEAEEAAKAEKLKVLQTNQSDPVGDCGSMPDVPSPEPLQLNRSPQQQEEQQQGMQPNKWRLIVDRAYPPIRPVARVVDMAALQQPGRPSM